VPKQNFESDKNAFLAALRDIGSAGNGALRSALGWAESRYWKAHAALFESGEIKKGRGRGGSVSTSHARAPKRSTIGAKQKPVKRAVKRR